ncbi:MAG: hypothetical protein ACK53Y_02415 [bacterium]
MPQIEGLTVEDMLELARTSPNALRHLPDECDWDGLNRKWMVEILYFFERAKFEREAHQGSRQGVQGAPRGEEQPAGGDAARVHPGLQELHELLA